MLTYLSRIALVIGFASQYAIGPMQTNIRIRQARPSRTSYDLPIDLPDVDGYVASQDCDDIGSVVWLRPHGAQPFESFLVADCASKTSGSPHPGESSYVWMVRNNILYEIDGHTARRWNTVGRLIEIERRILTYRRLHSYN